MQLRRYSMVIQKFYSNFVDKDGVQLMPLTYDANKWVLARDACKEAIELAVLNGHDLYKRKITGWMSQKLIHTPKKELSDVCVQVWWIGNHVT